jgi:hypothetical protein
MVACTYLQATHVATVLLEVVLRKSLSYGAGNLMFGSYWEDHDKSISHMFAKMMVIYIDVLGTRAKL